jgi:nucleotide-binding universal stress UspA family protein
VALHAWEAPFVSPDVMAAPHLDVVGVISQLHERALELVSNAVDEVVGDDTTVAVEPTPAEGPPAEVLVDAARDADLLVVGSRGLGLTELLLGSVSQHCVQHAPCPVVIHRHKASTEGA